jgi:hypothetical protein
MSISRTKEELVLNADAFFKNIFAPWALKIGHILFEFLGGKLLKRPTLH